MKALGIIRDGLAGQKHFVETIFNPWNVAEKLSSKKEVQKLKAEQPQKLIDALEVIAKSEANHVRNALEMGVSGIFLAIANAQEGILTPAEYSRFSEPFDDIVLDAARSASLNILHLHGEKLHPDQIRDRKSDVVIHYSAHAMGLTIAAARKRLSAVIMGGIDERNFRKLSEAELKRQVSEARSAAGSKFILAPGCSVPNETTDAELKRLTDVLGSRAFTSIMDTPDTDLCMSARVHPQS